MINQRRNTILFFVYSAFFHAGIIGMMDVLLNFYFVSLGNDPETIGLLNSLPRLAGFITSVPIGLLCNRIGTRKMLFWSSVGCSVTLGVLLFPSLPMLAFARFMFGMFYGAQQIANFPLMIALVPPAERTRFFALQNVISMGAMALGSFIGGSVPTFVITLSQGLAPPEWTADAGTPFAYGSALVISALIGLIGVLPLWYVKPSAPTASPSAVGEQAAQKSPLHVERGLRGEVKTAIPWGILIFLSLPMLTFGFTGGLTFPSYNLFFRTQFDLPDQTVGTILSIGWIGMALIPLLNATVERRFGRAGALGLMMVIGAVGFFGLGLLLPLAISVIFFVIGLSFRNTMQPLYQPLLMERIPDSLHNVASSMTMVFWNIGWFVATAISGFLQTTVGFGLIMHIVAAGVLLNGIAVVLIFRSKRAAGMETAYTTVAAQGESN